MIIDNETILLQQIKKSESEYNKEVTDFNDKFKDTANGPILSEPYPNMYKEDSASPADFSIGQKIKVETDNNIRDIKEFKASTIVIQYSDN